MIFFGWDQSLLLLGRIFSWLGVVVLVSAGVLWEIFIVGFLIFIHRIVVHRGDEAIRGWQNRLREDPLVRPYRWLRSDLVPPAPFLTVVRGSSLILPGLMRNSEKPGFPTFVVLGKGGQP